MDHANPRIIYPPAPMDDAVDLYHGVSVADPYRWLEDLDSDRTIEWINRQNALTESFISAIPEREELRKRLTDLWNYEKLGTPWRKGDRYFLFKNHGLQNQSVLYTLLSLEDEPSILLDPNTLSDDGTVALGGASFSEDGKLLAYSLSAAGSDWQKWYVRDVATGLDLPDVLTWVKFSSASWTHDNAGFYYSRYDEPAPESLLKGTNYYQKLYYHRLGSPQSSDRLVYERPDEKEWGFNGRVTEDARYLVVTVYKGTDPRNRILYLDLSADGGEPVDLIDRFDASFSFLGNSGPLFWFRTNLGAPRGRIVGIDIRTPERERWVQIVAEDEEPLEFASWIGGRFVACYLRHAHSQVRIFSEDGALEREIPLPGAGSVEGFYGEGSNPETFYSFTSFTSPLSIYRLDVQTGENELLASPTVDFDPADFVTTQVFVDSKDGTSIPVFISHRRGLSLDGKNPTFLYGYGGFNISLTPGFSVPILVWMERGGVYAQACLRGGGEYGESWHQAGTRERKQNVFDDFVAAADWLIDSGFTSRHNLAIGGGSNGGLLVGAALTQQPGLFAAASPTVGVLDMLRFHKFTIGWAWIPDYGCADDPDDFDMLYRYSPLHNLKNGVEYPATLIMTGDHDDRVFPAHSFKFAAALQAAQAGSRPILIRIERRAGHGAGKPISKLIAEATDRWAFLFHSLK